MARRGSHWGSFGKGFMDSLLAVYRIALLREQQEYQEPALAGAGGLLAVYRRG